MSQIRITAFTEYTCADYISVSFAHLVYTCGDSAYYVLTAVWINPQVSLTVNEGTKLRSLFYFLSLVNLLYQPACAYIHNRINGFYN